MGENERIEMLRMELARLESQTEALNDRKREVRLAIEEAEGRGDGQEAAWLRAIINKDFATSNRLYNEWVLGEGARIQAKSMERAKEELARFRSGGKEAQP